MTWVKPPALERALRSRIMGWGLWTGSARVRERTELDALHALRDAVGPSGALPSNLCQRLWVIQVLHLLADAQGQARMAERDLEKALPGQPAAAPRPRL